MIVETLFPEFYTDIAIGVVVGHTGHTAYDHYLFLQNSV